MSQTSSLRSSTLIFCSIHVAHSQIGDQWCLYWGRWAEVEICLSRWSIIRWDEMHHIVSSYIPALEDVLILISFLQLLTFPPVPQTPCAEGLNKGESCCRKGEGSTHCSQTLLLTWGRVHSHGSASRCISWGADGRNCSFAPAVICSKEVSISI